MYKIEVVKPLRLYKNKRFYLHSLQQDKLRENLFLLCGMTNQDNIDLINANIFDTRFIRGYFTERIIETKINNVQRRKRTDLKETYLTIKNSTKHITRTFPTVDMYNKTNLFYDVSTYNDIFFSSQTIPSASRRSEMYANFLLSILEKPDVKSYKNTKLLIPIDGMDLSRMGNSPVGCLLYLIYFNENKYKEVFDSQEILLVSLKQSILVRIAPGSLTKKTLPRLNNLLQLISKLNAKQPLNDMEKLLYHETEAEFATMKPINANNDAPSRLMQNLAQSVTGRAVDWDEMDTYEARAFSQAEDIAERVADEEGIETASELLDVLNQDPEFVEAIKQVTDEKLTASKFNSEANTKRNELLKQEQKTRRINDKGRTLEEVLNDFDARRMDREEYDIPVSNKLLKSSTLKDFEVSYNKKQKDKDTLAILNSFSKNKEIPMYVKKIERYNSSDSFNKKETWHVTFEDERRLRHEVTFDMPLFIDDHFLYTAESKKSISHQFMLLPIVKTAPDRVQCVSNYNKAFIFRYGQKISPKIERLKKLVSTTKSRSLKFLSGDSSLVNVKYLTNIEYDELASSFIFLEYGDMKIFFNQEELRKELTEKGIKFDNLKEHMLPIGYKGNELIVLDVNANQVKGYGQDLADFLTFSMIKADAGLGEELDKISVGKKYVYSRCSVLSRKFPLLLLLAFHEGISSVLKKGKIKYSLSDKKRRLSLEEKNTIGEIRFKDCYFYYDLYPFNNALLLNALHEVPTDEYNFKDFDGKEVYLDIFQMLFGTRTISKGFTNFMELFMDPITEEVCQDQGLPTDLVEFFLHANSLLVDNSFKPENNMSLYRIRSNEIVNAIAYGVLARAYAEYRSTANNPNPVKMSVPRDAVLKEINECPIIQDYSCINPISEADTYGQVTYKGPSGLNMDKAFTLAKRSYDQTMLGLMGVSSPYNNKVG